MEKRNRLPNFTSHEENFLISLAEKHAPIIENKKNDAVASEEKRKVWEKIALEFEATYDFKRGSKNLKEKYENLKRMTRKNLAEDRKEIYKTADGQNTKSAKANVERLAAIMGRSSATGSVNYVDSDAISASGSAVLQDNLDESLQSAIMEDLIQAPEVLKNINSPNNSANSSSWNPAQLKKKRNLSLECAEGKTKSTSNPQQLFVENEKKRWAEKHRWEAEKHKREAERHNWVAEKHSWEKTQASLKTEILKLELKLKKLQMQ